jgi:hypothetical protein
MIKNIVLCLACVLSCAPSYADVFNQEQGSVHLCQIVEDRITFYENLINSEWPEWEYGRVVPWGYDHMQKKINHFEKIFQIMKCEKHFWKMT